jgi:hypothetical protein
MPALADALPNLGQGTQTVLRDRLRSRLFLLERHDDWRKLPSFHLSRWRAHSALSMLPR